MIDPRSAFAEVQVPEILASLPGPEFIGWEDDTARWVLSKRLEASRDEVVSIVATYGRDAQDLASINEVLRRMNELARAEGPLTLADVEEAAVLRQRLFELDQYFGPFAHLREGLMFIIRCVFPSGWNKSRAFSLEAARRIEDGESAWDLWPKDFLGCVEFTHPYVVRAAARALEAAEESEDAEIWEPFVEALQEMLIWHPSDGDADQYASKALHMLHRLDVLMARHVAPPLVRGARFSISFLLYVASGYRQGCQIPGTVAELLGMENPGNPVPLRAQSEMVRECALAS